MRVFQYMLAFSLGAVMGASFPGSLLFEAGLACVLSVGLIAYSIFAGRRERRRHRERVKAELELAIRRSAKVIPLRPDGGDAA